MDDIIALIVILAVLFKDIIVFLIKKKWLQ